MSRIAAARSTGECGGVLNSEVEAVNARWITLFALMAGLALGGCSDPNGAVFVTSERTEGLVRQARAQVEASLEESFGTPQELVAWRRLPIDFGEFTGVVEESESNSLSSFTATITATITPTSTPTITPTITPKADDGAELEPERLKGAAVVFTSGQYKDAKYEKPDGEEGYLSFFIVSYDPGSGTLTVRADQTGVAKNADAPAPGDKFSVIGPVLQHGRKMYMTHCLHCHGVSGDGNGPTAEYLNPRPRDYRDGKFKFTSTAQTERARRDDLKRVVKRGIPGTYMPSFMLLEEDKLKAVVEYVLWLAMRGEYERKLNVEFDAGGYTDEAVKQRIAEGETHEAILEELDAYLANEFAEVSDMAASDLAETWNRAEQESSIVVPKKPRTPDTLASRARGRKLFLSGTAKCADCHGPAARGDGRQTEDFNKIPGTNEEYAEPGLYDDWNNKINPRDLTAGIYRGGRRPIDLYRRISAGIKGTPMPPFSTVLNDDQIWDLVNYVMSIPVSGPEVNVPDEEQRVASQSENRFGHERSPSAR